MKGFFFLQAIVISFVWIVKLNVLGESELLEIVQLSGQKLRKQLGQKYKLQILITITISMENIYQKTWTRQ